MTVNPHVAMSGQILRMSSFGLLGVPKLRRVRVGASGLWNLNAYATDVPESREKKIQKYENLSKIADGETEWSKCG